MMFRKIVNLLLGAAVFGLAASEAQAQPYLPGPAATIAQFTSSTVLGPNPRTRTTIGIGEEVTCTLDPKTWSDTDINMANPEAPVNVADTIGAGVRAPAWAATGAGTVMPAAGNSTTLTASLSPGTVTVTAVILDSGTRGNDPAINQALAFSVIPPSGSLAFAQANSTPGWVLGPPNNQIGVSTQFETQVTPITVNFSNVSFRENIAAQALGNWPDGTPNNYPAQVFNYTVTTDPGGHFNWVPDSSSTGLLPAGRLSLPPGFIGPPAPFYNYAVSVPNEYTNAAGAWVVCFTDSKQKSFNTTTLQGRAAYTCDTTLWGNWMGPWQ